jgi:hypothetical protein
MISVAFVFAKNTKSWAIISPLIEKVQETDFSHCEIMIMGENDMILYGSEFPRSRKKPLNKWSEVYRIQHLMVLKEDNQEKLNEMQAWLENQMGVIYGVPQLFAILVGYIWPGLRKRLFKERLNGAHQLICSELLGDFMHKYYGVTFDKTSDLIDLNDVFKAAKKLTAAE